MNEIKIFCPATVSNVSCGFDVLGFCLEAIGDEMIIRKTTKKGIKITKIEIRKIEERSFEIFSFTHKCRKISALKALNFCTRLNILKYFSKIKHLPLDK